jgi:hypothetical protein
MHMPRVTPRRSNVVFRLSDAGIDWIDVLAAERGEKRSDTIRTLIKYASARMPRDWKPSKE